MLRAGPPQKPAGWNSFSISVETNQPLCRPSIQTLGLKKNTIPLHIHHCCHPSVACVTGLEAEEETLHGRFIAIHRAP